MGERRTRQRLKMGQGLRPAYLEEGKGTDSWGSGPQESRVDQNRAKLLTTMKEARLRQKKGA